MSDPGLKAYAEQLYRSPGVEPLLLDCQDRLGLDVLCLLGACWLAQSKRTLSVEGWRAVLASHSAWADSVVDPVRRARREVKGIVGAQALYEHLKGYELSAEWLALSRLETSLNHQAMASSAALGAKDVLLAYCTAIGAQGADEARFAMANLAQLAQRAEQ